MSRHLDRRQDIARYGLLRGSLFTWPRGPFSPCRYHPGPQSGGRGARRLPRAGRARRGEGGALPERRPGGAAADGPGAVAASRPGHDQAAGGSGGSPALDLLPHVPGDGDHGVSVEWGDARTRAADRRARLPEDDEALRSDGGHDHRRRDRAHRDLGVGRTARRRSPRDVRSTSRAGRAARVRVRHVGVRVARTLDQGRASSPRSPWGLGVLGSASMARRAHPGRFSLAAHQERRQYRSIVGWPACPGPVFARLDLLERWYAWLRRAVGSSSRSLETRLIRWMVGAVRATATCAVGILRLIVTYLEGYTRAKRLPHQLA